MKHTSSGLILDDEDIPEEIRMRETNMQNMHSVKNSQIIEEEAFEEIEIDENLDKIIDDSDVISDYIGDESDKMSKSVKKMKNTLTVPIALSIEGDSDSDELD